MSEFLEGMSRGKAYGTTLGPEHSNPQHIAFPEAVIIKESPAFSSVLIAFVVARFTIFRSCILFYFFWLLKINQGFMNLGRKGRFEMEKESWYI